MTQIKKSNVAPSNSWSYRRGQSFSWQHIALFCLCRSCRIIYSSRVGELVDFWPDRGGRPGTSSPLSLCPRRSPASRASLTIFVKVIRLLEFEPWLCQWCCRRVEWWWHGLQSEEVLSPLTRKSAKCWRLLRRLPGLLWDPSTGTWWWCRGWVSSHSRRSQGCFSGSSLPWTPRWTSSSSLPSSFGLYVCTSCWLYSTWSEEVHLKDVAPYQRGIQGPV